MKNKEQYKYILFPLPLLQEIFKKPKNGMVDLFNYGVYRSAVTQKISFDDALRQSLYCFLRENNLTKSLEKQFNVFVKKGLIEIDEYNGYFKPGYYLNEGFFKLKRNISADLENEIKEFYALYQYKELLNIEFKIESVIKTYHHYNNIYGSFERQPLVMINIRTVIDFSTNEKSEFEYVLFAAFAGIKSIIGRDKDFAITTQDMIFCRMYGAKNKEALTTILTNKKIKAIHNKYSSRYQRDKIINHLLNNNFISSKIWFNRRLYISCKLNYDELAKAIIDYMESKKLKHTSKSNRDKELEAKKTILRHLYK